MMLRAEIGDAHAPRPERGLAGEARGRPHGADAGVHRRRDVHDLPGRRSDRLDTDGLDRVLAVRSRAGRVAAPPGGAADAGVAAHAVRPVARARPGGTPRDRGDRPPTRRRRGRRSAGRHPRRGRPDLLRRRCGRSPVRALRPAPLPPGAQGRSSASPTGRPPHADRTADRERRGDPRAAAAARPRAHGGDRRDRGGQDDGRGGARPAARRPCRRGRRARRGDRRRGSRVASSSTTPRSCWPASCRRRVGRGPTSTGGWRRSPRSPSGAPVSSTSTVSTPTRACSPSAAQRQALDQFGKVDLGPLREAAARVAEIDATAAALGGDGRARAREIDLLRFQVAELDAAGLDDAGEDDALRR